MFFFALRLDALLSPEVDLTLIPDYLSICPRPMSLKLVEKLLGGKGDEERNREYLTHGEFMADMRLMFANALAYNNPDRVVEEVDRVSQVYFYF